MPNVLYCDHCFPKRKVVIEKSEFKLEIIKALKPKWAKTRTVRWNISRKCLVKLLGKRIIDQLNKPGNFTNINFYRGR